MFQKCISPPWLNFTLFFTKSSKSNFQVNCRVNQKNYILYSEQLIKVVQTCFLLFQSDRFLAVIFVFPDELGVLQWLLSLCLFSFFSQTLCCFTPLKKEKKSSKNASPFIVEISAASTSHSPTPHLQNVVSAE